MAFGETYLRHPDLFPARLAGQRWGEEVVELDFVGGPYRFEALSPQQAADLRDRFGPLCRPPLGEALVTRLYRLDENELLRPDLTGTDYTFDRAPAAAHVALSGWDFLARIELNGMKGGLWTPENGFRELPGTEVPAMKKQKSGSWWYPIVAVNSSGDIIIIIAEGTDTDVYRVDVDGDGTIERVGKKPFRMDVLSPSLMFDVDLVMLIATDGSLWVADISDSYDVSFTKRNNLGKPRTNAAMNVLPDGRVIFTGGSNSDEEQGNKVAWAVKSVQIWDPKANTIYKGPKEELARLYHSSGLILPDGSLYSGGGGAPGPLKNLNGNIYKPGYLFDPGTGEEATRPVVLSLPKNVQPGDTFSIRVNDATTVAQVTMTKPGAMTHSRNCDQRWLDLVFIAVGETMLEVTTPNRNIMIPGLWMLNVISNDGVPSEGRLLGVDMDAATNIYVPAE